MSRRLNQVGANGDPIFEHDGPKCCGDGRVCSDGYACMAPDCPCEPKFVASANSLQFLQGDRIVDSQGNDVKVTAIEPDINSFYFFETLLDEAHPSSKKFYDLLIEAGLLHAERQKSYGRKDDPLANVRASEEWGIPGWVGAMVRLNDKVRRLQSLALTGEIHSERAIDSFMDIAVYALLARVLYEQETSETSVTSV